MLQPRYKMVEWIQKQDPYICCLQETHFRSRDTYTLKVMGWKKILHANRSQKKAGVAILTSDIKDFKIMTARRDKGEGNGTPLQYSSLENPMDGGEGRLQSMGLRRVRHDWVTSLSLFTFMHWRRKWQPTPVFLPAESQGQGNLVGCRLWSHTELDTTEAT